MSKGLRLHSPRKAAPQPAESRRTANRPTRLTYAERRELEEITARIPQLDKEKTALEAKLSTGTLSHEDLMKASERIGELIEEMDLLTLRQLELRRRRPNIPDYLFTNHIEVYDNDRPAQCPAGAQDCAEEVSLTSIADVSN